MIIKILKKLVPLTIKKQITNFKILAMKYSQYKTIRDWECVDKDNNKIPWYTYPAIEYLSGIDFSGKSVFEYGSGNSSSFWGQKAKKVVSVENDRTWYEKVKKSIDSDTQKVVLCETESEYLDSIKSETQFYDVVIIDGMYRKRCVEVVSDCINKDSDEGFMVVLDNSDWYQKSASYLREELGLIQIDFHGFGPINDYTWTTSIFLSRNFNFKPIENDQPSFSVSAIRQGEIIEKCG